MSNVVVEPRASTILFRMVSGLPDEAGVHLLPANVCPVVPLTMIAADRRFEFTDLDPETLHLDLELVARRVGDDRLPPVAGILWVRTYGAEPETDDDLVELRRIAPSAVIVDDRCLCRPQPDLSGEISGADAVLFSTGRAKVADLGFGGFGLVSEDIGYPSVDRSYRESDLDEITRLYSAHIADRTPLYTEYDSGCLSRLRSLKWLDCRPLGLDWDRYRSMVRTATGDRCAHTAEINRIYSARLPTEIQLASRFQGWRFHLRVPAGEILVRELFLRGFWASRHYYSASHLFGGAGHQVAESLHRDVVNLPNDTSISREGAEAVADIVNRHFEEQQNPGNAG